MKHYKYMILIIFYIIVLLKPLKVEASAPALPINPGISPTIVSESEFTSWLFSLFGVRSHNTTLLDNTEYLSLVEQEMKKLDSTFDINEFKSQVFNGYVARPYKVTIPKSKFVNLGKAIGSTFALANALNVKVIVPDGEGYYNSDYTIDVLNNINNSSQYNYNGLKSYTMFTDIFSTYANRISTIYAYKYDFTTYNSTYIIFALDSDWTINNTIATFNSEWLLFVCNLDDGGITGASIQPKSKYDTLEIPQDGIIEIGKSNYIDGIVSIDPAFVQPLINGVYGLITPYTMDITAENVVIPIPKNIPDILDRVTAGEISATEAIEEAQTVPVDTTDEQAIEAAQAIVFSPSPEFQTYGLGDLFPFCIPFDIYHILTSFIDPPKIPEFDIKLPDGGHDQQGNVTFYTQHVSFEQFNDIASLARALELVIFGIGLAVITRSFIMRA